MASRAVNLLLDMGNSSVKWRYASDRGRCGGNDLLPDLREAPANVWVASVASSEREAALAALCEKRWRLTPWFARSEGSACGVTNSYAEPSRMGVDRWLAMIAAYAIAADAVCVVDAGSALTIDHVASNGHHRGGYIIPGRTLMRDALTVGTARVNVAHTSATSLQPGTCTQEAVNHGLMLAQVGAVAMAIDQVAEPAQLVFCGGDGAELMRVLGRGGRYIEDLVLDGLERLGGATTQA